MYAPKLIAPAALAAARRLAAEHALLEEAAADTRQTYEYGDWEIDGGSLVAALSAAAATTPRARDMELLLGDERLFGEFEYRVSPSGGRDWYEGEEEDPDAYDLGPDQLLGKDLAEALISACELAIQHGWVKR